MQLLANIIGIREDMSIKEARGVLKTIRNIKLAIIKQWKKKLFKAATYPYRSLFKETKQSINKTFRSKQAIKPTNKALKINIKPSFSAVNLEDPFIKKKTKHLKNMQNAKTI